MVVEPGFFVGVRSLSFPVLLFVVACGSPPPTVPLDAGSVGLDAGASAEDAGPPGWSQWPSSTTSPLRAVWGASREDVWAVGGTDYFRPEATGDSGVILHWQGAGWISVPAPATTALFAVHGSSASDVWAVGVKFVDAQRATAGVLLHWDGMAWSEVPSPTLRGLYGVWAESPTHAWIASSGGLFELKGTTWTANPLPTSGAAYEAVWGDNGGSAFAAGTEIGGGFNNIVHWEDGGWQQRDELVRARQTGYLYGLWGRSSNDVWAVGEEGMGGEVILHWDGLAWSKFPQQPWSQTGGLNDVSGNGASDVFAVGFAKRTFPSFAAEGALVVRWQDAGWQPVAGLDAGAELLGVWAAPTRDVWTVARDGSIFRLRN